MLELVSVVVSEHIYHMQSQKAQVELLLKLYLLLLLLLNFSFTKTGLARLNSVCNRQRIFRDKWFQLNCSIFKKRDHVEPIHD